MILKRDLLACVPTLNTELSYCMTGASIWQSKVLSALILCFTPKLDISNQRSTLPPNSSPWVTSKSFKALQLVTGSGCLYNKALYRMAKIYCHINQWIFHDFRETNKSENMFALTFIRKNKCRSIMQHILRPKEFRRTTYADGRATESLGSATKTFSHTIKQLLHQYHNIMASSFSLDIACSPYFVVLMQ